VARESDLAVCVIIFAWIVRRLESEGGVVRRYLDDSWKSSRLQPGDARAAGSAIKYRARILA